MSKNEFDKLILISLEESELLIIEGGCLLDYAYSAWDTIKGAATSFKDGLEAGYNAFKL